MLDQFEQWLKEVGEEAVAGKKATAEKTNISNWKKVIWKAPHKNAAIKAKFREMSQTLEALGHSEVKCRSSKNGGEWLYDLVWHRVDQAGNLIEVVLAMEIEMSYMDECIKRHDFNKLLQADSTYKVFVFQQKTEADVMLGMEMLKSAASHYRFRTGSDFLLCGWSTQKNNFFFDRFYARPDGAISPLLEPRLVA